MVWDIVGFNRASTGLQQGFYRVSTGFLQGIHLSRQLLLCLSGRALMTLSLSSSISPRNKPPLTSISAANTSHPNSPIQIPYLGTQVKATWHDSEQQKPRARLFGLHRKLPITSSGSSCATTDEAQLKDAPLFSILPSLNTSLSASAYFFTCSMLDLPIHFL